MYLNLFLLEDTDIGLIVAIALTGAIILLALVAFVIALVKRTKISKNVKSENNEDLISAFGSGNIKEVNMEMSRITVTVNDVEIVNAERIKELGASGVLLVGNMVKCSFKENVEEIYNDLKGAISNE